jgi:elongation factor Ts
MPISSQDIAKLRTATGAGMMDCKNALEEAQGDMEKAGEILRKKGIVKAAKRADKIAAEGTVASYIHAGGKVGVLLELNCETDFVARTDAFQTLAKDICLHIAAANPQYLDRASVPATMVDKEKEIYFQLQQKHLV